MKKNKKLCARILSIALSAAMISTTLPITAFAEEGNTPFRTNSAAEMKSFVAPELPVNEDHITSDTTSGSALASTFNIDNKTSDVEANTKDTFIKALSSVGDGGTIKITDSFTVETESKKYEISKKSITIDLNGKEITATGDYSVFSLEDGASLTIIDNSNTANGKITKKKAPIISNNSSGTFTLDGNVVLEGGSLAIINWVNGKILVKKGTLLAQEGSSVIYNDGGGIIEVIGGMVKNEDTAISASSDSTGKIIISGTAVITSNSKLSGTIRVDSAYPTADDKVLVDIQGGTVENKAAAGNKFAVNFVNDTFTKQNVSDSCKVAKGANVGKINPAPTASLKVGAQSGTLTYGKTDTAAFAITASNFAVDPLGYNFAFFSDAEGETKTTAPNIYVNFTDDLKTVTVSPGKADAGVYYFKLTTVNGIDTIASEVITLTIDQGEYSGTASKEVGIKINKTEAQSGTLTAADFFAEAPAEAKITAISNKSASNKILSGTPTVSAFGNLSYSSNKNLLVKDLSDTYDVTLTSKNYKDITAVLTFKTTDKMPATITASIPEKAYDGAAIAQPVPSAVEQGTETAVTLTYTYKWQKNTGTEISPAWSDLEAAPKDAGSYKLIIKGSSKTHEGEKEVTVTINKANVTVIADHKSMRIGDTIPTYTITYSGFIGSDNTNNAAIATPAAIKCIADGKTAGTYDIVFITNAELTSSAAGNYQIAEHRAGVLTVTKKSSGGGGTSSSADSDTAAKPSIPVKGSTDIKAATDSNGNAKTTLTKDSLEAAIKNAEEQAQKQGKTAGETTIQIKVDTGEKSVNQVLINLPKTIQDSIMGKKISTVEFVLEGADLNLTLDLKAITEINKQAGEDVDLIASRVNSEDLSVKAKAVIGTRPVFDLKAVYGEKAAAISSFGEGTVKIEMPYKLQKGEKADLICGVYVDKNGTVTYIKDSGYNTEKQAVYFETNHFSIYGVGVKVTPEVKTSYAKLQLKGSAEGKTNHVSWNKVSGATGYIVYASPCGADNPLKKIATINKNGTTKWDHKNLEAKTYYKYKVIAYKTVNGKQEKVAISPIIHVTTDGGKNANPTAVKCNTTALSMTAGEVKGLSGTITIPKGKVMKEHVQAVRYESSSKEVASVSNDGKIKAVKKGSCIVYIYGQNGVFHKVKVTVK